MAFYSTLSFSEVGYSNLNETRLFSGREKKGKAQRSLCLTKARTFFYLAIKRKGVSFEGFPDVSYLTLDTVLW
ncbi:MAG: hypothetical protein JXA60_07220 [Candidatus Coatesbacteria bacterium]|nr:hypothetical protein [Candidatus Coatesbacteria bacterium]